MSRVGSILCTSPAGVLLEVNKYSLNTLGVSTSDASSVRHTEETNTIPASLIYSQVVCTCLYLNIKSTKEKMAAESEDVGSGFAFFSK